MSIEYLPIIGAVLSAACLFISVKQTVNAYKNKNNKLGDRFIKNNFLSSEGVFSALSKLSHFVKKSPPDFIVGVNSGGGLIGAYISSVHGVKESNLLTWLVSDRGGMYKLSCPGIKNLHGSVLVINDMVRSGKTNQMISSALKENKKIDSITTASLFEFVEKGSYPKPHNLGFCAYVLTSKDVHLPWTTREKTIRGTLKKRIEMFKRVRRQSVNKSKAEIVTYLSNAQRSNPFIRF